MNTWVTEHEDGNHIKGWFGQLGPDTFWQYQSAIAPAVLLYRMAHDIAFSEYKVRRRNLPGGLMPNVFNAERVTPNLLGYADASRITNEQADFYLRKIFFENSSKMSQNFFKNFLESLKYYQNIS